MSNATDVLCVGGPARDRMVCLNRNAEVFPTKLEFVSLDPAGVLLYRPRQFWNTTTERWYWIATWSDDEPMDSDIRYAITVNNFNPAWDLLNKPAPESEA